IIQSGCEEPAVQGKRRGFVTEVKFDLERMGGFKGVAKVILERAKDARKLEELFKTCCRKFTVKVPRESNKSYGYAFIEFPSKEACRKALELNGSKSGHRAGGRRY
ncbi:hypothetical protein Tco_1411581, partial [Tanacetum coccineum]